MEEIKKNTPEDIKRVDEAYGLAMSYLGTAGNNDYEVPALNAICEEFSQGEKTAEEAVQAINVIKNSKNLR